ncbi:MAG: nicotine dehydrogenase subunit L [Methylobacteriaceae bacterium]
MALVSAGVVFPVAVSGCRVDDFGPAGPVELVSWVVVMPNNTVRIRIPQSDIGQGVVTTLSQVLAEEMDLDWSLVRPEFFDPLTNLKRGNVYVYTCTESSWSADRLFDPMRIAGAQIRHMLVTAASKRLGVDVQDLRTEKGSVVSTGGGRQSYAELALEASRIPPPAPSTVKLKSPADYRLIGKPIKRLDLTQKTTGALEFGIDVDLPGMLYAAEQQSPVYGGRLVSWDESAIAGMAGVIKVVRVSAGPSGLNGPLADGGEDYGMDDAVAVVADSFWRARKALLALPITWDDGDFANTSSESIMADLTRRVSQPQPVVREAGAFADAIAGAHRTLEADYHYPFMDAMPLEPINCTAWLQPDGLQVWASTQFAQDAHRLAAVTADLPPERVQFNLPYVGGGFGRRCQNEYVSQAVQIAKAVPGRPVKLIWTREEMMARGYPPPITVSRFKAGLDRNGKVIAWFNRVVSGTAPDQSYGPARLPHYVPNLRIEYARIKTPPPFGWMRGVGFTQHVWMNQGFQDELAAAAGRDPVDLYVELLDEGTVPTDLKDREVAVGRIRNMRAVLQRATQIAGWGTPMPLGQGRGVSVSDFSYWVTYRTGTASAVVDVILDGKGGLSVERVVVVLNCGRILNPEVVRGQVEGSVFWAITTALYGKITLESGRVVQRNFQDHDVARLSTACRNIQVELVPSDDHPAGVGEDAVPIVMTAMLNAIFAAGGPRIRSLPLRDHDLSFRPEVAPSPATA